MAQRPSESNKDRRPPGRPPFESGVREQPEEFTVGVAAYPPPLHFTAYEGYTEDDEEWQDGLTEAVARHAESNSDPEPVGK